MIKVKLSLEECNIKQLRKCASEKKLGKVVGESGQLVGAERAKKQPIIQALKDKGIQSIEVEVTQRQKKTVETKAATKEFNMIEVLGLSLDEQAEVETALRNSGNSLNELTKAGLLMKARKVNTEYDKLQSLTPEQRKQTTLSGAAVANLKKVTDAIVAWNHACYDNTLRVFINASILRTLTGSNLNTIKDFLSHFRTNDDHAESPDQHNERYDLTEKDNKKGRDEYGNRIKIAELINRQIPSKPVEAKTPETNAPVSIVPIPDNKSAVKTQEKNIVMIGANDPQKFAEYLDTLESESGLSQTRQKQNRLRTILC
jgi:hypothetical protein